jgi:hypothetical protein
VHRVEIANESRVPAVAAAAFGCHIHLLAHSNPEVSVQIMHKIYTFLNKLSTRGHD